MGKTNYDYLAIVNSINANGGFYNYKFPIVTDENFSAMAAAFVQATPEVQNAYLANLRNVMCNTLIKNVFPASNPFSKLYREDAPYTGDGASIIQEVMVDQIQPMAYHLTSTPDSYFKGAPPKVRTQIFQNIIRKKYELTINANVVSAAFRSLDAFADFWGTCMSRMYADMEEDDKEEIMAAIDAVIYGGNMRIKPAVRPVDSQTALAFSTQLETLSHDLSFKRRRDYNLSGLSTKTSENNAVMIFAGDVISVQNNYNLAWAFNKSYIDLDRTGQIIPVDSDGMAGNKVFGIYTDTDFFRIHNIEGFPILKMWENGENLEEKRWLHNWKMVNFSYGSNAVAFVDPKDIGINKIEILTRDGKKTVTVKKGKYLELGIPKVTADPGKLADAFVTYSISGNTSEDTAIDPHTGFLVIAPDEQGPTITITGKHHLNPSKTATITVTVA